MAVGPSIDSKARADEIADALLLACDEFETAVTQLSNVVDVAVTASQDARRDRDAGVKAAAENTIARAIKELADAVLESSASVARLTERFDALEQRAPGVGQ